MIQTDMQGTRVARERVSSPPLDALQQQQQKSRSSDDQRSAETGDTKFVLTSLDSLDGLTVRQRSKRREEAGRGMSQGMNKETCLSVEAACARVRLSLVHETPGTKRLRKTIDEGRRIAPIVSVSFSLPDSP